MLTTVTMFAPTTPGRYTHSHILYTHTHSSLKFIRSTAGDETFPLSGPILRHVTSPWFDCYSLPCLFLYPNMTANQGAQRTASLMTRVINDSDPEAVENKQGTAKEEEQRKKGNGGREKKFQSKRFFCFVSFGFNTKVYRSVSRKPRQIEIAPADNTVIDLKCYVCPLHLR